MEEKQILIVEDNVGAVVLLQSVIKQAGYNPDFIIARSSKEGIDYLNTQTINGNYPDVIFLDLNMPKENGWCFLDYLAVSHPNLNSKIFILTTSINRDDIFKASQYPNVLGYYNKPITMKKANEIVHKLEKFNK